MGNTKSISPRNNSSQRVHPKDQMLVLKHDPVELAKKERRPAKYDKELPRYSRLQLERNDNNSAARGN